MPFADKTAILITKGDGTVLQDLEPRLLLANPSLTTATIAEKYVNPKVPMCVEGKFIVKHSRKVNMKTTADAQALATANAGDRNYPMTNHEATRYDKEETGSIDKETLVVDATGFITMLYDKKIDANVWEGQGIINDHIASFIADTKENRALMVDNALCKGLVGLHTAAGAPKAATFSDGTPITGIDGQPFTLPALVHLTGVKLAELRDNTLKGQAATDAADKMIAEIFVAIKDIHNMGKKSKSTKQWAYARGNNIPLDVRTHPEVALLLRQATAIKGNVSNVGLDQIKTGVQFTVNNVTFTVDNDLDEAFLYQILPLGGESPIYIPKRYDFSADLRDDYKRPNNFWRLSCTISQGVAQSNKNMAYARFGMAEDNITNLTTAFAKIKDIADLVY